MPSMEAVQKFNQAQRDCRWMWQAMRYARLNLTQLQARPAVSQKDLSDAHDLIQSTKQLYFQAMDRLFVCHDEMMQSR